MEQLKKMIEYNATGNDYEDIILALMQTTKSFSDNLSDDEILNAIKYIKSVYKDGTGSME
jgi:hypothetical protein